MSNFLKDILAIAIVIVISAMVASRCEAGLFLDLDLGMHLNDWHEPACDLNGVNVYVSRSGTAHASASCTDQTRYIGHKNPLGSVRIGYQSKAYKIGVVKISGHGYLTHTSSAGQSSDKGMNAAMAGVRFEL